VDYEEEMTIRPNRHKETLKKIYNSLSKEEQFSELMLDRLYQLILRGDRMKANIICKATIILFPKSDVMVADVKFRALWKSGKHRHAIRVYHAGKLFWHSETIGQYYEKRKQMAKAIEIYDSLMNTYSKIGKQGILPLPRGSRELFVLGRWYVHRNKVKARKFLTLYLSAEKVRGNDPAFFLRHKNEAQRLLDKLNGRRT
jgi:hypothetical protein